MPLNVVPACTSRRTLCGPLGLCSQCTCDCGSHLTMCLCVDCGAFDCPHWRLENVGVLGPFLHILL